MALIGFSGKAGSGKDTAAKYLAERYGVKRVAFADKLKDAAVVVFGFNHEQVHGSQKEQTDYYWNLTPRYVLQRMGTESMRNVFGPDIWIKSLFRGDAWKDGHVAISDVRFVSEAQAIRANGGIVVRLKRNPKPHVRKWWQKLFGLNKQHQSEIDLDDHKFDHVIDNTGDDIQDLYRGLDMLMLTLRIRPVDAR